MENYRKLLSINLNGLESCDNNAKTSEWIHQPRGVTWKKNKKELGKGAQCDDRSKSAPFISNSVSDFSFPIKRQFSERIKKKNSFVSCIHETHLNQKEIHKFKIKRSYWLRE